MAKLAWLAVISLASLALAGCAGGSEQTSKAPVNNQTYEVKVLGSHALQNKDRTFKVDLVQGGATVGTTTFTVKKGTPETPVVALTKMLPAGPITANVFEGSNPVGTKTLDPAKCPQPLEFEMHAIDDALHTYSNCD
jgi:hypothetical protein